MYLTGGGYANLSPIFDKLRSGGNPELLVELRDMPFGIYGLLTDRYGIEWFFRGAKAKS
jgi:PhnB protein